MIIKVSELQADDWQRLRAVRLKSLQESPDVLEGSFEAESKETESDWRQKFSKLTYVVASLPGSDVGLMSIEVLDGDFGVTCWIGGCWVSPEARGKGALRAMFNYVDEHAPVRDWSKQGLGVMEDNLLAIKAYEKLGFVAMGDKKLASEELNKYYQRMIRFTPS
jgi:ribosomal protein S18 acetylase RimI-like enzyme